LFFTRIKKEKENAYRTQHFKKEKPFVDMVSLKDMKFLNEIFPQP